MSWTTGDMSMSRHDRHAESMALFTQAVIQGAFILAKAHDDPAVAADCIAHLRRYLESQLPVTAHDCREGQNSCRCDRT